jgi:hypothetical protein
VNKIVFVLTFLLMDLMVLQNYTGGKWMTGSLQLAQDENVS